MRRLLKAFQRKRKAFTLAEVLISIVIILVLSAASIPLFAGLSKRQAIEQNTQKLISDIHLVRSKSVAGAVIDSGEKVWWGIRYSSCGGGIGLGADSNEYELGYIPLDSTTYPPTPDLDEGFKMLRTESLSSNILIWGSNSVCNTSPIYFERLTGIIYSPNSPFYGPYIDEALARIYHADDNPSTDSRIIRIIKGGNIKIHD